MFRKRKIRTIDFLYILEKSIENFFKGTHSFSPHLAQNFASNGNSWLHFGQSLVVFSSTIFTFLVRLEPQIGQNFASSSIFSPQYSQLICPTGFLILGTICRATGADCIGTFPTLTSIGIVNI